MKKDTKIQSVLGTNETENKVFGNHNPFKVPEHYFETLPTEIFKKINTNQTTKRNLVNRFKYATTMAAAIAILFFVFWWLIPQKVPNNPVVASTDNYNDVITEYLEDNLDENTLMEMSSDSLTLFSPDELATVILTDDTTKKKIGNEPEFKFDTSINNNEIMEYLINENIDPETL
ncbi:MAG: hypothetical protein WCQ95_07480 [Bacteroidota bacterium]